MFCGLKKCGLALSIPRTTLMKRRARSETKQHLHVDYSPEI